MDDQTKGPENAHAIDQLNEIDAAITPAGSAATSRLGDVRAGDALKWWRWQTLAGRWMPSEPPPQGEVGPYWSASVAPPTTPLVLPWPDFPDAADGQEAVDPAGASGRLLSST